MNGSFPPPARQAFTLIELMIVVVIMAVLSGLALPMLLRARDRAARQGLPERMEVEATPKAGPEPRLTGSAPVIERLELHLALSSNYHRIGMEVFTRYRLECSGTLSLHASEVSGSEPVLLFLPFPRGIVEGRDVRLVLKGAGPAAAPPADIQYHQDGISCRFAAPPDLPLLAEVSYTAFGRESLEMPLPPARRLGSMNISLDISGARSMLVPDDSLQPTTAEPPRLAWNIENLVSDRPIRVEIPGAQSPMAMVLLLLRYVAVAVLFFGAGFWYLSELAKPGQLDAFRGGEFLLLALTYALFFVIFAVLEFHGICSTLVSMLVAAAFSLPLVVFVVAGTLGMRFALSRVVPLVLFSLGIVINGVYGGAGRDFLFLGAAILVIGFVTLTYETWEKARRRQWEGELQAWRDRRQQVLEAFSRGPEAAIPGVVGLGQELLGLLEAGAGAAAGGDGLPSPRERTRLEISQLQKDVENLGKRVHEIPRELDWLMEDPCSRLQAETAALLEQVGALRNRLDQELRSVRESQARARPAGTAATEIHCLACGKPFSGTPFCPSCGAAGAEMRNCGGCGAEVLLPRHLLPAGAPGQALHCRTCGRKLPGPSNPTRADSIPAGKPVGKSDDE